MYLQQAAVVMGIQVIDLIVAIHYISLIPRSIFLLVGYFYDNIVCPCHFDVVGIFTVTFRVVVIGIA
jgi:hypothetical protein